MSSHQARELAGAHPDAPAEAKASSADEQVEQVVLDKHNNLVPIAEDIEPDRNPLHTKLEDLAEMLKARDEAVDERLETLEPISEALVELAADLGMRTEDLEKAAETLAGRADGFETAHQELTERTAMLATATDRLREENDRRAHALETWTEKLKEQADQHAAELARLDGRTNELDQMDYQLSEEISAERSRINKLTPRVETLEEDSAQLQRKTRALAQEDGAIRQFLKRAVWSAVGVAVLLAGAIGVLSWSYSQNSGQIDGILSDLGVQQQQIASLEGMALSLVAEMQAIPEQLDELYEVVVAKDAQLQKNIDVVGTEVAEIKQRIFIPDENLAAGAYDLSKVRADAWLLGQQPGDYTIQIVGVYGKNALANFIGRYRNHLDLSEIAYLQTTYKGRDWYVLVQGSYASAAAANAAMDDMSPSLQKNGPYVRKFQRIQERVNFRTAQAAR